MSTSVKHEPQTSRRALLAERLRGASARTRGYPLSFAQQRLWFLDQLEPNSALYNVAVLARVEGRLDPAALERAINRIISRHEALRTCFVCQDGTVGQVVAPELELKLQRVDLAGAGDPESEAKRLIRDQVNRPFNLATGPLLRAMLISIRPGEFRFALVLHHIIVDEWSLKVFFRELGHFYAAAVGANGSSLPELPIQYADYAGWQREWLKGEVLEKQLNYWRTQLGNNPPVTELPCDTPPRSVPSFRGASLSLPLGADLSRSVRSFAQSRNATLFMVLLAGFKALLRRYTRQDDLIVGSPIAGRTRSETENLIGFFVNTLLLRTNLAGNPTFSETLNRVRETALAAYRHQDLPFDTLVEELHPERSLNHLPFARIMFVVQNGILESLQVPGAQFHFFDVPSDTAKFDLTLVAQEGSNGLSLNAEYNADLFDRATVARLLEHYRVLLEGAVTCPDTPISDLPLLTSAESRQLLAEWNRTETAYPRTKSVHELFETQAERTPEAIAVKFGDSSISYSELNQRANQLASYLRQCGVGPDVPVCICARRSINLIIGLLGTLKAGGAYVPLDIRYPKERIAFVLGDTRATIMLTEQILVPRLPTYPGKLICLDTDWELIAREERSNLAPSAGPENLAYVMYTSGSTGRPKGVAVPHRAITRLVLNTNYVQLDSTDRVAQVSNSSFDAATFEIWGALLNGAQLVGITRDVALSPKEFAREIRDARITVMFLTTALFNQLAGEVPGAFQTLRTLMVGGEVMDPKWARAVLKDRPPRRLLNIYGPTENTTFTCYHVVERVPEFARSVPIGRPISNTQTYILDEHMNPVPAGVTGELYAGGDGLARGYWNLPQMTAEKFVRNPFSASGSNPLLYRTGDLARYLPDGNIEFLGRIDNQVKIRGFRIEPGEIETVLDRHPAVRECVVAVRGNGTGDKRLIAYVVAQDGGAPPNASELRSFLTEHLPDYMVPSVFVPLTAMPLNDNGKVDRRALPEPDQTRPELERQYLPPSDDVEIKLTNIWEEVLNVRPIGIHDKFFDLGGHSLLAVRVIAQIEKVFGRKLRLATIFQAPTVEQLAAVLRQEIKESSLSQSSSLVEIQSKGCRSPLFLVHGAGGGMFWGYVNLSRQLGLEQPVYGFKSRGLDGREELEDIERIAAQYVGDLKSLQPEGPYYLGGYCFGGVVAFEMARQLTRAGEKVAFLGLLNCAPPNSRYTQIPWTPRWGLRFIRNIGYWLNYCRQWTKRQRREFMRWKWALLKKRLRAGTATEGAAVVEAGDLVDLSGYTEDQRRVWEAHIRALLKYQPKPYDGRVHLFRSAGHPLWCSFEPDYGWGDLARQGVEVTVVPGAHEKILEEGSVEILAGEVGKRLRSLQTEHSGSTQGKQPASSESAGEWGLEGNYAQAFAEVALKNASAVAVRSFDNQLTYGELEERANQLAHYLQGQGVGPEVLVAVCLDRSLDLIVSLLAIAKAGGAYVPLDPDYPVQRLEYMLEDSGAGLLLTESKLRDRLRSRPGVQMVCLDDPAEKALIADKSSSPPNTAATADNVAYVIYTSGTTGEPKGVEITNRALLNHNRAICRAYALSSADRVLQFAPISFDISVEEIFPTWLAGATLVLRTEETMSSAAGFVQHITREAVTVLNLPTAFWHELVWFMHRTGTRLPDSVRLVVIGGEKVSDQAYLRWKERVSGPVILINGYGVTEATVTSLIYEARREEETLPIGHPIANTHALVLDDALRPVGPGQAGELYIGGAGVARGYLKRPELTSQKFIPNPFSEIPGERLYRTGDLVRVRQDGAHEFLGRADDQVKVRGYRIELGEVEAVLQKHPDVQEAAVICQSDKEGQNRLVAYLVPRTVPGPQKQNLVAFLRARLPGYMVPSAFVSLKALPLTPAGKIDKHALPALTSTRPELAQAYVAPGNALEDMLAGIWAEVLSVNPVGVHDNFFDLGGHSLHAIQVLSRIRENLNADLEMKTLFSHPTVAALAGQLAKIQGAPEKGPLKLPPLQKGRRGDQSPLSFVQERLWFIEQLTPGNHAYNLPAALRLKGELNLPALNRALNEIVQRHEALRTTFQSESDALLQRIEPSLGIQLGMLDLSDLPASERDGRAQAWLNTEAQKPFDLARGPLLRAGLVRLDSAEHILLVVMHHTISDGWSVAVFFQELANYYDKFASGKQLEPLPDLPVQYADFAWWQREVMQGETLEREIAYWKENLSGAPPSLALPADHEPEAVSAKAARRTVLLDQSSLQALNGAGQTMGLTPFMLLMSALTLTLHKWTGQKDLVLGTVVAGRNRREVENLIGCFMNFLPVRARLSGAETVGEFLNRMRSTILEGQAHQDCPFEKIVEAVNPDRRINGNPLYNVALLVQNYPAELFASDSLQATPVAVNMESPLLDLRFEAENIPNGFSLTCEYRTDLFDPSTIEQLLSSYVSAIGHLTRQPEAAIADLKPTAALEEQATRVRKRKHSQTIAITATFTAEPLLEPLRFWSDELELQSAVEFAPYGQVFQQLLDPGSLLATNSRGLNVVLLRLEDWQQSSAGHPPASSNGQRFEASLTRASREFIAAIKTATARTSTPFLVSICPCSPQAAQDEQKARVVSQVEAFLQRELEHEAGIYLLDSRKLSDWYPVSDYHDAHGEELGHVPYTPMFFSALGTAVARMFHALLRPPCKVIALDCDNTLWSGVCGEDGPKGVRMEPPREALQAFFRAQLDSGVLLTLCSKNNEEDVNEVFAQRVEMPLRREHFTSTRLNWAPKSENLKALAQELNLGLDSFVFVDDNPVECAEVEANCPQVMALQLPEDPALIPQFLKHCWIFDHLKLTSEDRRRAESYRQTLQRERLRASSTSLADFLASLELKIDFSPMSEAQLARVAQLTQRTNQFNTTTRRRTEGELRQLLGEWQVTSVSVSDRFGDYGLTGVIIHRQKEDVIEVDSLLLSCRVLGRGIEHRILAHLGELARTHHVPWVDIHFVSSAKNKPALDFLNGVGAEFRQPLNGGYIYRFPADYAKDVVFYPRSSVPAHPPEAGNQAEMPPSSQAPAGLRKFDLCRRIALELTTAQKIHERVEQTRVNRTARHAEYAAPANSLEEQLCKLWERLLHVKNVGVLDNFFDLGGHSLLAVRLFSEIEKLTGRKLPLVTVFQAPTVRDLVRALTNDSSGKSGSLLVPIQPQGSRPPLFLVHGAGGDVLWGYANLAAHLSTDQPVYGIKSRGQIGLPECHSVPEMAWHYLEAVRAFQPKGPYYLGGYCFGGNVAYEMARQLRMAGEEVALVALLDSAPSNAGYEKMTPWKPVYAWRFACNFYEWLKDFSQLESGVRVRFLTRKLRSLGRKLKWRLSGGSDAPPVDLEEVIDPGHFPESELKLWQIHLQALTDHVEGQYPGKVVLLRTRGQPVFCSLEEDFCWGRLVRDGVQVVRIPGSHENIFMEPNVRTLAKELTTALSEAQLQPGQI